MGGGDRGWKKLLQFRGQRGIIFRVANNWSINRKVPWKSGAVAQPLKSEYEVLRNNLVPSHEGERR